MFTSEVANDATRFSLVPGNDLHSEPIYRRHERIIRLFIIYFYLFSVLFRLIFIILLLLPPLSLHWPDCTLLLSGTEKIFDSHSCIVLP